MTRVGSLLAGVVLLGMAHVAWAKCDPATSADDAASVANARAAADAACHCGDFTTHGAYVSCAAHQINATLDGSDAQHNRSCRGKAKKCYAKSICGKSGSFVICRRTNAHGGSTCSVKAGDCTACVAPNGGSQCCDLVSTSCCDNCSP